MLGQDLCQKIGGEGLKVFHLGISLLGSGAGPAVA
jgi:hypothetical protein